MAALWPARAATRAAYSRALAQRNALLARIRAGAGSATRSAPGTRELAGAGDRAHGATAARPPTRCAGRSPSWPRAWAAGDAELRYRPRSPAATAEELAAELAERRAADLDRGFTAHGPHRDELQLRSTGSPCARTAPRASSASACWRSSSPSGPLLAERRSRPPLMLLDDVMSELDADRRKLLAELLRDGGQAIITATDAGQVPGADARHDRGRGGRDPDRGAAAAA